MCRWNVVVKDAHLQTDKEALVTLAPGPEPPRGACGRTMGTDSVGRDELGPGGIDTLLWPSFVGDAPVARLGKWGWRSTDDGKGAIGGEAEMRIGLRMRWLDVSTCVQLLHCLLFSPLVAEVRERPCLRFNGSPSYFTYKRAGVTTIKVTTIVQSIGTTGVA
jgi:hypothetical protein